MTIALYAYILGVRHCFKIRIQALKIRINQALKIRIQAFKFHVLQIWFSFACCSNHLMTSLTLTNSEDLIKMRIFAMKIYYIFSQNDLNLSHTIHTWD